MTSPAPFRIEVSDDVLERIRAKVAGYVWHEMPDDGGWAYGANLDYMKELCAYWLEEFDWRAQEARLNRFSHFTGVYRPCRVAVAGEWGEGAGRWVTPSELADLPLPVAQQRIARAAGL